MPSGATETRCSSCTGSSTTAPEDLPVSPEGVDFDAFVSNADVNDYNLELPEFQNLAVGDEIPLGRGPSWPVAAIEPNRARVLDMRNLGGFEWVWQFGLYTVDENRTQ